MSLLTYVGAAAGLAGAVPAAVAAGPPLLGQVAASFASKLAPAGLGGMALNVRFLQKQGVDRPVAVSGVGLSTVAGLIVHISLIGVFIVWAGRDAFGSFHLPDAHWFLIGAARGARAGRRSAWPSRSHVGCFSEGCCPVLRRAFDGLGDGDHAGRARSACSSAARRSRRSATCSPCTSRSLAFGGGLPFATVGAVYLVGSAVASAAPTPGGLGAMEAALIGGLVAAGLANDVAVPAVFLFRLATFWLPILPGWLSFTLAAAPRVRVTVAAATVQPAARRRTSSTRRSTSSSSM